MSVLSPVVRGLSLVVKGLSRVVTGLSPIVLIIVAMAMSNCGASPSETASGILPETASLAGDRPDYYPAFSWDKVPVMAHFGKHNVALTDQEIDFLIRHFSWIVLEKGHAMKQHGSTEAGILADAKRLKAANPDCKVLHYWNASINFHGMYDAVKEFEQHPEWAVRDKNDSLVLAHKNTRKRYDHRYPELREWWVDKAAAQVNQPAIDGVFIDALPQIAMHRKANIELLGQEKQDAQEEGLMQSLAMLREKTPGKILIYNGLRGRKDLWADMGSRYLKHMDAAMVEHFTSISTTDKESIANNIEVIQQVSKTGKIVVVKGFPEFNWMDTEVMKKPYAELEKLAQQQLLFPLAAFLVAAGENSYFCYSWGYRENDGTFSWYPEFDKPLGRPLADAVRDGWKYKRAFEHCEVEVDIETKAASINWK